jgi:exodeoxyribonuclease VII small subunit
MSFTGDMERLQEILDEFEEKDPDMERSLVLFDEGVKLIKDCREFLVNAKRKVTVLLEDGHTEEEMPGERPSE